jgi:hypothetical protein
VEAFAHAILILVFSAFPKVFDPWMITLLSSFFKVVDPWAFALLSVFPKVFDPRGFCLDEYGTWICTFMH